MRLAAVGLGHAFEGQPDLFRDLTFELAPGQVAALTGPSGSGKTTLLGLLAGWSRPRQGTVDRPGIRRIAWVFQNPHGVPARAAVDHVALPLLAQGLTRAAATARAHQVLTDFGLDTVAARPFRDLSGGEAQRLMLARAITARPDLILVDEPTAQLDPTSAQSIIAVLGQMAGRGAIVVIATHDPRVTAACGVCLDLGTR